MTQAKPDGYTLAAVWNAPLTVTPHTLAVSYTLDDYTPITQLTGGTPFVFCVKPDFPAANGKEFIELLRKNPDKFTYGNDGVAGSVQLAAERAFGRLGVKARPVPFGGAGETVKNFLGGHVDIYGGTIPTIIEYVRAGQAKCLLVTSAGTNAGIARHHEPGRARHRQYRVGIMARHHRTEGHPARPCAALQKAFHQATQQRKFLDFEASRGESAIGGPGAEFGKIIKAEYEANAEILKRLGLGKKN